MRCPICKKAVEEAPAAEQRSAYPFCSERCKLVDLGRWLDGKYQISAAPDENDGDVSGIPDAAEDQNQ